MRVDGVDNSGQQDNKPKVQVQSQAAQNVDIHTQYKEFVEKQKSDFNSFRKQAQQEFNDFVKEQNEEFNKALGFERQVVESTPAPKMVETGPNTPEYDKAIHSYEQPKPVDATPAPKMVEKGPNTPEYDKAIHSYEQPKPVEAQPPKKAPATDKTIGFANFVRGISQDTKDYLNSDQIFEQSELAYMDAILSSENLAKEVSEAKAALQNAKAKLDQIPGNDFAAKKQAYFDFYQAQNVLTSKQETLKGANAKKEYIEDSMLSYATKIDNWEDGKTFDVHKKVVLNGVPVFERHGEVKQITLENGQKAYELNGEEIYPLAMDGDIDWNNPIKTT